MDTAFRSLIYIYRNFNRVVFSVAARSREDADAAYREVLGEWPGKFIEVEVSCG